jgi:hypothetical protein
MSENERKSKIALGIVVICVIFGLETRLADARMPNPLTPWVWALLALAGALVASVWFRRKDKHDRS